MDKPVNHQPDIGAFNYHIEKDCNMHCAFCFATFRDIPRSVIPEGHLELEPSRQLIRQFGEYGFSKANFVGGEPFLHPYLPELVDTAKQEDMVTSVVTNGSLLLRNEKGERELDRLKSLDWLGVSIDSIVPETLIESGRVVRRDPPITAEQYLSIIALARARGIKVKINTVVHAKNAEEDISDFIAEAKPDRWKVMRMLPVAGQRPARRMAAYAITGEQFAQFRIRHASVSDKYGIETVFEDNNDMSGSYVMVDPSGRIFDNYDAAEGGAYKYSQPILDVGIKAALEQTRLAPDRFYNRGGDYYLLEDNQVD